ncbi:MAG: autotransporter domain-containing protein [Hyphomicrobiales bacterium]
MKLHQFVTLCAVFLMAMAINVGLDVRTAHAAWDDCSGLTVTTGGDLTLDVTADSCSLVNTFPGTNNYINFNAGSGSSVTIDLIGIDDAAGDFSSVSITHDGGTDNIANGVSFGQANDFSNTYNCSAGCTVSGNYSAAPISGAFSITYTQNAGSGSLSAATAPEISVSSSVSSGTVADGGTDAHGTQTVGSQVTVTYTVTNSGTGDLTVATATSSSASNVTVNSIGAPGSGTVTSGGGTTSFQVQYTPTAAGAFSFGLSFVNDDGDENPFNFTVSGTGAALVPANLSITSGDNQSAQTGMPFANSLIATVTDSGSNPVSGVSVTFTAPSSGASLTFAATGTNTQTVVTNSSGQAISSVVTANNVSSAFNGASGLASYSVVASASGLTSVSFSMTNGRNDAQDIQTTNQVIESFVTNRANSIISSQPDLTSRLTNGPFRQQRRMNGFNVDATPYVQTGSFQFSLRALANSVKKGSSVSSGKGEAQQAAIDDRFAVFDNLSDTHVMGYASAAPTIPEVVWESGWDVWAQGTYARTNNNHSVSQTGLFFAGVDYRYRDQAVFGLMGQFDINKENNSSAGTSSKGVGWMVGPYGVVRLHENLHLDAAMTYGQSYNSVNALGLFADDFNTERFLFQTGLTGEFMATETVKLSPFARLSYYFEEQKSYTDSLGRSIPSQDFDLGRLEFGPKISWELNSENGFQLLPFLSLSGIYDFNKLQDGTPSDPTLTSAEADLRARIETGASLVIPDSQAALSAKGFFDGVGVSDFQSYGLTVDVMVPF